MALSIPAVVARLYLLHIDGVSVLAASVVVLIPADMQLLHNLMATFSGWQAWWLLSKTQLN